MLDPALAEAATAAGLLALGGLVLVPRAVVCVGAGAALGWAALLPAMAGSALGAGLGFALARYALAGPVRRLVARRPGAAAVLGAIEGEGWRVLGLLRLASPVPGPVVNAACGVSRMGFGAYITASVAGLLPQTVLFVYLGRSGRRALADRALGGPHALTAGLGVALTLLALWRLRAAARKHTAHAGRSPPPRPEGRRGTP